MKHTLLLDKENVVYAKAKCIYKQVPIDENDINSETEEVFMPSLFLDEEAINMGCKMVMVEDNQLPMMYEIFDCSYDFEETDLTIVFKQNIEHMNWRAKTDIRAIRKKELIETDYLVNATSLTGDQKLAYAEWKQAWLDAPETLILPTAPDFVEQILIGNGLPSIAQTRATAFSDTQNKINKIK